MQVLWDKLSALPFVAPKSNLFLNCCSYYLVISIKTFQLIMNQIHRGPLIPFGSDRESVQKEKRGSGAQEEEAEDDNTAAPRAEHQEEENAGAARTSSPRRRRDRLKQRPHAARDVPTSPLRRHCRPSSSPVGHVRTSIHLLYATHLVCRSPTPMLRRNLHPAQPYRSQDNVDAARSSERQG